MTNRPGPAPLEVAADLTLTVDGVEATLTSTGDRLFLEFPSVGAVGKALRGLPATERRRLHETLTVADLALEVRARHRTLAVLGAGTRSGPLARKLGLEPVELRACGLVSALWAGAAAAVEWLREPVG